MLAGLLFWFAGLSAAAALELVMFEREGCGWCARWNRDIAPLYHKTDEGKRAPLRRFDIERDRDAGFTPDKPIRYTPTFVVVDRGKEIGRITGYLNDDAFWTLLKPILAAVPAP